MMRMWRENGTKILGTLQAFVAGVQGAAAVMTPMPFSPKEMVLLAGINMALAGWTVRRGFVNGKTNDVPPEDIPPESQ